ncbi:AsmA family protein [Maridesulfovibrio sp.]|uniref:AsmA family protein n=1 Tax=Maridesulfovibrio sp. TaxID=2795000 RepID=UPI0029F593F2|nr:AsmA family protein [Maridesulfovibrio sp.]
MILRVKKLFWILFILFDLCILAAVTGGVYYMESDEPRLMLEELLSEKLQRKVSFHDNFELNFYPWLGVNSGPVTVASEAGSEYPYQLTVQDIDFKVRFIPLLSGKLEVDTIVVDSPSFRVSRLKDGSLNLPVMKTEEHDESEAERPRYFNSISVRGASIFNATCSYSDLGSGNSFNVSGVNIRTGLLRKGTPLAFNLSANFDTDFLDISAQADLKGLLDFSLKDKQVSLSETSLAVKVESEELLGAHESAEGIASLGFNLVDGKVDVNGLVLQGAGVRLSGAANCTNIYDQPDFKGWLKSTRFDPKKVFSRFTPAPIPQDYADILNQASFAINFHSTLEKTELTNIVLAVDNTVVKGDFSLKDYKNPWVEFNVQADSIQFDPYEKLLDLEKTASGNATETRDEQHRQKHIFRDMVIADMVKKIPCNGRLEVGRFDYDGISLNKVAISVSPGPKVADLSIDKGSYLDGDFALSAEIVLDEKREAGVAYLRGKGTVSPFSLALLPLDVDGLKFNSGKAAFNLKNISSSGRTPLELVRNLRLDTNLEANGVVANLRFKGIPPELKNLNAEKAAMSLKFSPLSADVSDGLVGRSVTLDLSGKLLKPEGRFKGSFKGGLLYNPRNPEKIAVKDGRLDFSVGGKGVPVIKKDVSLTVAGSGSLISGDLKLDDFAVKSGKINLHGSAQASRLGSETVSAKGEMALPETACNEFFELFGVDKPETVDPNAFAKAELDASFQLNGENLTIRVEKCRLDDASAQGTFQVSDFKEPVLNFNINADRVDVDHFLPPSVSSLGKDNVEDDGFQKVENYKLPEWKFPDRLLGAINATGTVECNYFRIFDFGASKVSADVDMQNAVFDIHNMKADFHEGALTGKLDLGLKNGTVSLDTDIDVRGFQAGLFFVDYVGRDYVKGRTDASLNLKGHSTANTDFVDTMTGDLFFKILNGSYLFAATAEKDAKDKKAPSPTNFSIMAGNINGKDGKFNVADYLLKTDYLTATATGGFSFPENSINLRVNADIIKLPNLYLKLVNALLDALTGVNVTVTGKLSNPKVEVKGLERWSDVLNDVLGLPQQSFMFFRKLIF